MPEPLPKHLPWPEVEALVGAIEAGTEGEFLAARLAKAWDEGHRDACPYEANLCRKAGDLGANPYRRERP